jgi:ferredoxin--NADP+ reductase
VGDEQGRVRGLEVEDTTLAAKPNGGSSATGLGTHRVIEGDTVIFCIGDRVDTRFGLPLDKWGDFAKSPSPRWPSEGISYEAYDPQSGQALQGIFLAGWSREASTGLVGAARKDGTQAAEAVLAYLQSRPEPGAEPLETLQARLLALPTPVVYKADLQNLEGVEAARAAELGAAEFKFSTNEEMLTAIGMAEEVNR